MVFVSSPLNVGKVNSIQNIQLKTPNVKIIAESYTVESNPFCPCLFFSSSFCSSTQVTQSQGTVVYPVYRDCYGFCILPIH